MTSVLQDWVQELPLREQGSMLTALRGCDLATKYPLNSTERWMTAWIRYCVMNAFDPREIDFEDGAFMRSTPPSDFKLSRYEHYPFHYVMHLLHAVEVIAFRHPDKPNVGWPAFAIYQKMVQSMHLNPESEAQMIARLSEDRIKKGTVL